MRNFFKNTIMIEAILLTIWSVFTNTVNAESFFERVFESGKAWSNMAGSDSNDVIKNAEGVFNVTNDIFDGVRFIGALWLMASVVITIITLSVKNNGQDKAEIKLALGFSIGLSVLFIFAKQIITFLQLAFEKIEGLM